MLALKNFPGTYFISFILPETGILFTWTLYRSKKILTLRDLPFISHSSGKSVSPINTIFPSAGETITSSLGIALVGSLKK